jgi:ubiquinol-cytochrome c reductase cytochrome b subunit
LPRLYISHVLLVPGVLVALISLHLTVLIRQKHSQFPGPAPVAQLHGPGASAVRLGAGGPVRARRPFQINPVWLYGPFDPGQVTSPAQPDWYVALGDGALRLFPPVEFRIFAHLVPAPFLPGVGLAR